MARTKRCPYCAEAILAAAVKCRHCGEFLKARGAPCGTTYLAGGPRSSTPTCGDNALTIVIVVILLVAMVAGVIVSGYMVDFKSKANGSGTADQPAMQFAEPQQVDVSEPAVSEAYRRGYDQGLWSGNFDRNRSSYDGLTPNESKKRMWAGAYQYRSGTQEYGDYWAGYDAAYLEARQ